MMVSDSVKKMMEYVREGEWCSCPFIVPGNNSIDLAMFTYYAIDDTPIVVFGFGQFLSFDGNTVKAEERSIFKSESEFIIINDSRMVPAEKHKAMHNAYYSALQDMIEHYYSDDRQHFAENLSATFKELTPDDALEMYRRICPEYLTMLKI